MALFLFGNYNSVEISPNIIWLVAEDQSVNFFPMYGDETIDLPNLSSLREDGILYENAYSPVPVCAPARSSIITGMYPTSLGTHNMRTYAEFPQPKPSKDIINYSPVPISNVKMFTEYLRKKNYYTSNYGKEDYNFKKTDGSWDYSCTGGSCSQKLEPLWRERKKDQPFFAVFNFGITHTPSGGLRGGKYSLFEAGTKVPFISYWRGKINPGVSNELISQVDLLNSISSIIGSEFKSNDGIDLSDLLLGNKGKGRDHLVVEASTRTAFRKGDWVIIPPYDAPALNKNVNIELGNSNNFQLYNLEDDPFQKNNLAKIEKEKLKEIYNEFLKIRGDNFSNIESLILE